MEKICIQGVVIHALAFQEYDRIITVFTPQEGLLKLFVKGAFSSKKSQGASSSPLTLVEAICSKGRSELFSCRELNALNLFLDLRKDIATLEAACDLLRVVQATQMSGKAAPELYQLLLAFLGKLPQAPNPLAISASFRLKTLFYEGLLELPLEGNYRLTPEIAELIEALTLSRDFKELANLPVNAALAEFVTNLFQQRLAL